MATDTAVLEIKTSRPLERAKMRPTRALAVGRRWMVAVVAVAPFLVVLEDHAMVIALPSLQRDLGLGLAGLEWVVNIYTLTFAVLTLGAECSRTGSEPGRCSSPDWRSSPPPPWSPAWHPTVPC